MVRMGQLDGVEGMGLFSLAPKAVAKVMLEESSASVEDLEMEIAYTKVKDGSSVLFLFLCLAGNQELLLLW